MPEIIPTPKKKPSFRPFKITEFAEQNPQFKTWQLNAVSKIAEDEDFRMKFYKAPGNSGLTISAGVDMAYLTKNQGAKLATIEPILQKADLTDKQKEIFRFIAKHEIQNQPPLIAKKDVRTLELTPNQAYKLFGARLSEPVAEVNAVHNVRPLPEDVWNTALDMAWVRPGAFAEEYKERLLAADYNWLATEARKQAQRTGLGGRRRRFNSWADVFEAQQQEAGQ